MIEKVEYHRYPLSKIVDATGFEPATSASRTQRSTKLSHASKCVNKSRSIILTHSAANV